MPPIFEEKKRVVKCRFKVTELVEYAPTMNFIIPDMKVGIVIEVLDIQAFFDDEGEKSEADRENYYRGFMAEWENYNRLREIAAGPQFGYPEERERLLERTLKPHELSTACLLKVLWNTGVQYIEHPDDLILFDKNKRRKK